LSVLDREISLVESELITGAGSPASLILPPIPAKVRDFLRQDRSVFFEGSEKKLELSVKPGLPSLRALGDDHWRKAVKACEAQILSQVSNDHVTAYLLSESSLFVYDHHLVMITCGRTKLINAIHEMIGQFSPENIDVLIFERKHEVFPRKQPTHFFDDVNSLQKQLSGKAYRFGDEDEHHLFLYHLDRPYRPSANDVTLEILMHGVQGEIQDLFSAAQGRDREAICRSTGIRKIFEGFQVDDHFFEPQGYSLNAIKGELYYTLHVTPQEIGSYVSFETNYNYLPKNELQGIVDKVTGIFQPCSFDTVTFQPAEAGSAADLEIDGYGRKDRVSQRLSCGYQVEFVSYFEIDSCEKPAFEFDIKKLEHI
jgi:S-adenosylmethionine decarboxylase